MSTPVNVWSLFAIVPCLCMASFGSADERHQIYAPPLVYGEWKTVRSHIGEATFKIQVEPIGDTVVTGEVEFFDKKGKKIRREFFKSTTVEAGNHIATLRVRLKGTPTGSSCWVDVSP